MIWDTYRERRKTMWIRGRQREWRVCWPWDRDISRQAFYCWSDPLFIRTHPYKRQSTHTPTVPYCTALEIVHSTDILRDKSGSQTITTSSTSFSTSRVWTETQEMKMRMEMEMNTQVTHLLVDAAFLRALIKQSVAMIEVNKLSAKLFEGSVSIVCLVVFNGASAQHNTTQHNTTQHNTQQHNTTQHNTTQHSVFSMTEKKQF